MDNQSRKIYVVYNPKAGGQGEADALRAALAKHFLPTQWSVDLHETVENEDVTASCRAACDRGLSLMVSAGGDGTLVSVANALVNRQIPLGILPLGTGNLLAKVLGVPLKLEEAIQLLVGDHTTTKIDALKVGERYFFSNVSVGISPTIMGETKTAEKSASACWRMYGPPLNGQPCLIFTVMS